MRSALVNVPVFSPHAAAGRTTSASSAVSVPALWNEARRLRAGASRLDLHDVTALDSAGLALLAELAADGPLDVHGTPPGLTELCGAYRLTPTLGYVSA